jgi:hypothetical protein
MSPLVVALTLAAVAPPSLTPAPQVAFQVERLRPTVACHDIDPSFVRYVAPPQGAGPLWDVGRSGPGARTLAKQALPPTRFDCPRLTAASGAP